MYTHIYIYIYIYIYYCGTRTSSAGHARQASIREKIPDINGRHTYLIGGAPQASTNRKEGSRHKRETCLFLSGAWPACGRAAERISDFQPPPKFLHMGRTCHSTSTWPKRNPKVANSHYHTALKFVRKITIFQKSLK